MSRDLPYLGVTPRGYNLIKADHVTLLMKNSRCVCLLNICLHHCDARRVRGPFLELLIGQFVQHRSIGISLSGHIELPTRFNKTMVIPEFISLCSSSDSEAPGDRSRGHESTWSPRVKLGLPLSQNQPGLGPSKSVFLINHHLLLPVCDLPVWVLRSYRTRKEAFLSADRKPNRTPLSKCSFLSLSDAPSQVSAVRNVSGKPPGGVAVFTLFKNRQECHDAGVHVGLQQGISGTEELGATSIVMYVSLYLVQSHPVTELLPSGLEGTSMMSIMETHGEVTIARRVYDIDTP
jgi:hypothetical protein